jgi:hypothetical protein
MPTLFFLTLFICGCSLSGSTGSVPVQTQCNGPPSDQSATINGHFLTTPIPITVHTTSVPDFNEDEMNAINAAIATWNQFFSRSKQMPIFSTSSSPAESRSLPSSFNNTLFCNSSPGLISNGSFSGSVVIYKLGTWPSSTFGSEKIAITLQCTHPSTTNNDPYAFIYDAVTLVNYQNFFIQGQPLPDLETIIAHELGHVLGLKHSCENNSTITGMPDCNLSGLDATYQSAIMFPSFTFNQNQIGEQKRQLGVNDEGRANCIY